MKSIHTKLTANLITYLVVTLVLFVSLAQAQSTPVTSCVVQITSLKEGDKVGPSATVRGTANVPVEGYLYLVARKSSMGNQWWPQAGGAVEIDPQTGVWEAEVFFGTANDVESNFDVAAVVVNQQKNKDLAQWFSTAQQRGYPPVRFPDTISACAIARVRVTKH